MITTEITITGDLNITVYDQYGLVKESRDVNNLVVQTGKETIASLLGAGVNKPTHLGLGSDNTPTVTALTDLTTPVGARIPFNIVSTLGNVTTYVAIFNPLDNVGTFAEAALFTDLTVGTMFARTTFNDISITTVDKMVITWNIRVN